MPNETAFLKKGRQDAIVLGQLGPTAALCCPFCKTETLAFDLKRPPCLEVEGIADETLHVPVKCSKGHRFEIVLHNRDDENSKIHLLVIAATEEGVIP